MQRALVEVVDLVLTTQRHGPADVSAERLVELGPGPGDAATVREVDHGRRLIVMLLAIPSR